MGRPHTIDRHRRTRERWRTLRIFYLVSYSTLIVSVDAHDSGRKSDKKRVRENSRICAEKFPQKVRVRL